jgi:hypothetical protein
VHRQQLQLSAPEGRPALEKLSKQTKLDDLSVHLDTDGGAPIHIGPTFEVQMLESTTSPTNQFVFNRFSCRYDTKLYSIASAAGAESKPKIIGEEK